MKNILKQWFLFAALMVIGVSGLEAKTLYLNTGGSSIWNKANAKFSIYYFEGTDITPGFSDFMTVVDGNADLYVGEIPDAAGKVIFVRHSNTASTPSWDNKWNQTGDLVLTSANCYTVTSANGSYGSWSTLGLEVWTIAGDNALVGANWSTSAAINDMQKQGDDYVLVKENVELQAGNYDYKAVKDHAWTTSIPQSGNNTLVIAEAGIYTVTFTLSGGTLTAVANKTGDLETVEVWTIAGVAALVGENWSETAVINDMEKQGDDYVLIKENVELPAGNYEYKAVKNHAWGTSVPQSGNNTLVIAEAGIYTVTFTLSDGTLTAVANKTGELETTYYIKNGWNGGDWAWQEMTPNEDKTEWTYTDIFGGSGVNINTARNESGQQWYAAASISGDAIGAGNNVTFTYTVGGGVSAHNNDRLALSAIRLGLNMATFYSDKEWTVADAAWVYTALWNNDHTVLTLTKREHTIPANEGVMIVSESLSELVLLPSATGTSFGSESNSFLGATSATTTNVANTYYILAKNDENPVFKKYTGASIPAGKAYLMIEGATEAPAMFVIEGLDVEEDITTAVAEMLSVQPAVNGIFTILGAPVTDMSAPGIYVKNGKKIIVK